MLLFLWKIIKVHNAQKHDRAKTKAIQSNEIAYKLQAAKQLKGEMSYICRFIIALAEVLESLSNLLKKNAPCQWSEEQQQVFQRIKDVLSSSLTMNFLMKTSHFTICLTSTNKSMGALLA